MKNLSLPNGDPLNLKHFFTHSLLKSAELGAFVSSALKTDTRRNDSPEVDALEERIMLSASPIAVAAEPEMPPAVDQTDVAVDSADAEQNITSNVTSIVFIDSAVDDLEQLVSDFSQDTLSEVEVILLDSDRDGIEQISEVLSQRSGIESVHIVSHGSSANVQLGSTQLNSETLSRYAGDIAKWNSALTSDADLLIYGCDLAATEDGKELVDSISALTGADVAASDDLTGHADLGGDWDFEYVVGAVDSELVFSIEVQQNWYNTLETFTVTTQSDVVDANDGVLSLREALVAANANGLDDTILLAAGTYDLTITGGSNTTGDLDITSDVEIIGAADGSTTIDASTLNDRVFDLQINRLTLRNLTITGGSSTDTGGGGALLVASGTTAFVENVNFVGNTANLGGAIRSSGNLTLVNSTLRQNFATVDGGGLALSGQSSTLENVTISGNQTDGRGGGIFAGIGTHTFSNITVSGNEALQSGESGGGIAQASGTMTLHHATITENSSLQGSGLSVGSGTLNVHNSIIAGNAVSSDLYLLGGVNGNIDANSIVGDDTGLFLAPLADNGGSVETHELLAGSVGIDGSSSTVNTDARGYYQSDAFRDIGAFERGATSNLDQDLIAYFQFEEGTGSDAVDSSVTGNTGNFVNSAAWTGDSAEGDLALDLSGDAAGLNSHVSLPDNPVYDLGTDDFTVALWYKMTTPSETVHLIGNYDGLGGTGFRIEALASGEIQFERADGAITQFATIDAPFDGQWHHLTASVVGGEAKLYIDGVEQLPPFGGGSATNVNSTAPITIGAQNSTTDDFEGQLDDVRIYARALDASEATQLAGGTQSQSSNTAPLFGLLNDTITYVEGSPSAVALDADVTIFDQELSGSDDFGGSTLTIERVGGGNPEDNFNFVPSSNLRFAAGNSFELSNVRKGTYTNGLGTLTLTFDAGTTNADVNEVMQSLGYRNFTDNPPASVDIQWTFSDGNTGDQGSGGDLTATGTTTVNITPVNDLATTDLDANDSTAAGRDSNVLFTGSPVNIALADAIIIDPDSTSFARMDVQITNLLNGAAESLAVDVSGYPGFNANYIVSTGTLVISGTGTQAEYEAILRSIQYDNTAATPDTTTRSISVEITDGGGFGAVSYANVEFSPPLDLSSGIELNTDGGNDAYLISQAGLSNDLTASTIEVRFAGEAAENGTETAFFSYFSSQDVLTLTLDAATNGLEIDFGLGAPVIADAIDYRAALLDGEAHTLSVTWDNAAGDWEVYVDGQLVEAGTGLSPGEIIDATTGRFAFGNDQDGLDSGYTADQRFAGTFYDARVWSSVRTSSEIAANYNVKLAAGNLPAELEANWQMDGFDAGEVVELVSGNNLQVGHAIGAGFTPSTPVEDLHVDENSPNGTSVGFVVVGGHEVINDVAVDGRFTEQNIAGSFQTFTSPDTFGGWNVTNNDAVVYNDPTVFGETPLGGRAVELGNATGPGSIQQTLNTVAGQQYQLTFAFTGDFNIGETGKDLQVDVDGTTASWQVLEPNGWTAQDPIWDYRTMTFTATGPTTTLAFQSLDNTGAGHPVIGDVRVIEIPAAISTILNNDPSLSYDGATGKFYRSVSTGLDWNSANSDATSSLLNGVSGQLVQIESEYENALVRSKAVALGGSAWLGGSDAAVEGTWQWSDGTTFFSGGDGVAGVYQNTGALEPSGDGDHLEIDASTGGWNDLDGAINKAYIVQWDATEVLTSHTFALTDDADGRFTIDAVTGEITVADGLQLDYETNQSHDVTVAVQDAAGNAYDEDFTITVNNVNEAPSLDLNGAAAGEDVSVTFTEGDVAPLRLASNATVDDFGENDIVSLTMTASGLGANSEAFFVYSGSGFSAANSRSSMVTVNGTDIAYTYDAASGTFTFTNQAGPTTPIPDDALESLIRGIRYLVQGDDVVDANVDFEFVAEDASGQTSTIVTSSVNSVAVNDAPVVAAPANAFNVTEGGSVRIDGAGFTVNDPDTGSALLTVTMSVGEGRLLFEGNTGVVIIHGNGTDTVTFVARQNELATLLSGGGGGSITYLPAQSIAGDAPSASTTITLTVADQGNTGMDPGLTGDETEEVGSAQQTINIAAVNDAPAFLGPDLVTNGDFATGDLSAWTTTGVVVFDAGELVLSPGNNVGVHSASQTIATVAGETYTLEFDYRDDATGMRNQSLDVTVDGNTPLLATETILTEVDGVSFARYRYEFVADSSSTTLTFTDASEDPDSLSTDSTLVNGRLDNISVRQSSDPSSTVNFVEGGEPVVLDSDLLVFDSELSFAENFNGSSLTLVRNGGANGEDAFSATGLLSTLTESGNLVYDGTTIGTVTTNSGGALVLSFNAAATNELVNNTLSSIAYSNTSDTPPASVQIDWTFDDGGDSVQTQGGAALQATGSTTVSIQNAADLQIVAPMMTATTDEDTALVFSGANQVQVFDGIVTHDSPMRVTLSVDNGTLQLANLSGITIVEGADQSGFMVIDGLESDLNVALAGLTFTPDANYNGGDTLNITTAVAANLEGHYTFDDGSASDSTGAGNDGSFVGTPTTTLIDGRQVLTLDAGESVVIPGLFGEPSSVTLAAWVQRTGTNDPAFPSEIISLGDNVVLRVTHGGRIVGFYYDADTHPTPGAYLASDAFLSPEGNHLAITISDSNTLSIYVDGVLAGEQTFADPIAYPFGGNTVIGAHAQGETNLGFVGHIDDLRIYNRALAADEIAALATDQTEVSKAVSITVNPINDAPVLSDNFNSSTASEGNGAFLFQNETVTDVDGLDFDGGRLTVTVASSPDNNHGLYLVPFNGLTTSGDDVLVNGIVVGTNGGAGSLRPPGGNGPFIIDFNANATAADVQQVFSSMAIYNSSEIGGTRVVEAVLTDGDGGVSNTVSDNVNFIARNDAPVLDNSGSLQLTGITEDELGNGGNTVAEILASDALIDPITDADGDPDGIAITNLTGNGTWQFDTGAGWTDVGSVSATNALLLGESDRLRYVPDGENGETATVLFQAWDQTSGTAGTKVDASVSGGRTAFSDQVEVATVSVSDFNDAPVMDNAGANTLTAIQEDDRFSAGDSIADIIASSGLADGITDVDTVAFEGVAIFNADTTNGSWEYSTDGGTNWIDFGNPSSTAALLLSDAAQVRFVPDVDFSGTAFFSYRAWDQTTGTEGGTILMSGNVGGTNTLSDGIDTATITVNPANDSPTVIDNGGAVAEGGTLTLTPTMLQASDIDDAPSGLTFTVDSTGNGQVELSSAPGTAISSFTQAQLDAGEIVFVHDGSETTTAQFEYTLADGGEDGALRIFGTFDLSVSPVNDGPTATNNGGVVDEGAYVTLTPGMIQGNDVDDAPADLTYTISNITNGQFELSGAPGVAVTSFTQADIDSGQIVFLHDGSQTSTASFDFSLADGGEDGAAPATGTFNFTVISTNVAPESVSTTSGGTEDSTLGVAITGTDVDGTVEGFRIINLPANGTLYTDAGLTNQVTANSVINAGPGGALSLWFVPTANWNGTTSFDFAAIDNDGLEDATPATKTLNFAAVNDAPSGTDNSITLLEDNVHAIAPGTFGLTDIESDVMQSVIITTAPTDGTLELNGVAVTDGQEITVAEMTNLLYRAAPDVTGIGVDSFTFQVRDDGGTANGGVDTDPTPNTINVNILGANDSPVLTSSSFDLTDINEDQPNIAGTTVASMLASLGSDGLTDSDSGALEGIAVTGVDNTNGDWQYSTDGGGNWQSFGAVNTFTATLLHDDALVRFVPNADYNGSAGDLEFYGWDRTNGFNSGTSSANIAGQLGGDNPYSADSATATLNVLAVNDTPTATAPTTLNATEQFALSIDGAGFSLGDVDSGNSIIEVVFNVTEGMIVTGIGDSGVAVSNDFANGTSTITGTVANISNLLAGNTTGAVSYQNNADSPSATATLTMTVNDLGNTGADPGLTGDATSEEASTTTTINITSVNDAPSSVNFSVSAQEDAASVTVVVSGSDVDGNNTIAGYRILSLPSNGTLYSDAALTMPVTVNSVIPGSTPINLFYVPDLNFNGVETFNFATVDDQGLEDPTPGSVNVNVSPVNDESIIANLDGDVVSHGAGDPATLLDAGADALVTDVDSPDFDGGGLTIEITNADASEDSLSVLNSGTGPGQISISGTDVLYEGVVIGSTSQGFDPASGAISLGISFNANANEAAVSALLKNIAYTNSAVGDPTTTPRVVEFVLADGDGGISTVSTVTVNVTSNVAPESADASFTGNEDAAVIPITISGSDSDGTISGYRIVSLPANGTLYHDVGLTNPVTTTTLNTTLTSVALFFVPDANFNGIDTFEFATTDNLGLEDATAGTVSLNVTPVNDAPVMPADSAVTVAENTSLVGTFSGTDPDGDTLTYSLAGADAGLFVVNSVTGEVSFASAPDADAPVDANADNVYEITVTATDNGTGMLSDSQNVTVTVTDVNESNVSTPIDSDPAPNEVDENEAVGSVVGLTAEAFDLDSTNNTVTYRLIGNPDGLFQIDANTGVVTTAAELDYEVHGATRTVVVEAASSDGSTATEAFTITIGDVNELGVGPISDVDASVNAIDEHAAIGTSVGIIASASDADATNNTVTYQLQDDDGGRFQIDPVTGEITVAANIDFETEGASRNITVRAQSSDGSVTEQVFSVAVNDVNEAPTVAITGIVFSVAENTDTTNGVRIADIVVTDDALGTNGLFLSGADADLFEIVGNGLRLRPGSDLDFESMTQYNVSVEVDDTTLGTGADDIVSHVLAVSDVDDEAPVLDPGQNFSVSENSENGTFVGAVAATDVDTTIALSSWSIVGGNEDGNFAINPTTGAITVADNTNLDFESSSSYDLLVAVSDGEQTSAPESVAISVLDGNDAPVSQNDTYFVDQFNEVTVFDSGVLQNDSDQDGDPLTAALVSGPEHGTLTLNPDGTVTYAAQASFVGSDFFTYRVSDGTTSGNIATVEVVIAPFVGPGAPGGSDGPDADGPDDSSTTMQNDPNSTPTTPANSDTDEPGETVSENEIVENANPAATPNSESSFETEVETETEAELELVDVLLSDAFSTDPSNQQLESRESLEARLKTLRNRGPAGSVGANYSGSLVAHVPLTVTFSEHNAESSESSQEKLEKMISGTYAVTTASLSVGYVLWLIRGGSLLASFTSALPAWTSMDPLSIVAASENDEESEDGESLLEMVDGSSNE